MVAVMMILMVAMLASGRLKIILMRRERRMPMTMVMAAGKEVLRMLVRKRSFGLL